MLRSRFGKVLLIVISAFVLLEFRLFYLQIIEGKSLFDAASAQREVSLPIQKDRGNILDRSGIPFTNNTGKILALIQPSVLNGNDENLHKLSECLKQDQAKLRDELDSSAAPVLQEIDENSKKTLLSFGVKGISLIYALDRYNSNSLAKHIIGYMGNADGKGHAGIEKSFEDILNINGQNNIIAVADARNNLIKGLGYRLQDSGNQNKKLNVKLTLDYHIQEIVENVMDRHDITGAVVVEDVNNGDILAMASKPDFDQNNVGDYLGRSRDELFNRAVASYNLGSIFKIIDAVLFFESGMDPSDEFFCPGYIKVGNLEFKCSSYDSGGHGIVDFSQAFAKSCNPFFINAGLKLGYKNLIETAQKFGLGSTTGIDKQGIEESSGKLPDINKNFSLGDIANISIGQGDILATPLQVADIVATIANGGIKHRINLVDSVVDDSDNVVKEHRVNQGSRIVSENIAQKVREVMEQVTENGTGTKAGLAQYGGSGGKTGTAETGQYVNGIKVVHGWFAGYFPQNNPKYSIAVFAEDGKSGGQTAAPVFEEIAEEISRKGL